MGQVKIELENMELVLVVMEDAINRINAGKSRTVADMEETLRKFEEHQALLERIGVNVPSWIEQLNLEKRITILTDKYEPLAFEVLEDLQDGRLDKKL